MIGDEYLMTNLQKATTVGKAVVHSDGYMANDWFKLCVLGAGCVHVGMRA